MGLQVPSRAARIPPPPRARSGDVEAEFARRVLRLCDALRQQVSTGLAFAIGYAGRHAAKFAIRALAWRQAALVTGAPMVLPAELRAAMLRVLAYLAVVAAVSLIAAGIVRDHRMHTLPETAQRPIWTDVERPWPAFAVSGEDDAQYAIRRHSEGGGRKDILSFGELGRTSRFRSFEIYRSGNEVADFSDGSDEMRDIASAYGRVTGLRDSLPVPSKFGPLQTFEFTAGPGGSYNCVGFVRVLDEPHVRIGGLACETNVLIDRTAVSCALDRLTLMSAGSDPEIARLFARAELRRSFCGQRDHLLYATPKRLDEAALAAAKPQLRGQITR